MQAGRVPSLPGLCAWLLWPRMGLPAVSDLDRKLPVGSRQGSGPTAPPWLVGAAEP